MITIDVMKPDDVDVQEIVQFTIEAEKQLDEQLRCGRTEKEVEVFVRDAFKVPFYYVLAREDKRLVGLAGLYVLSESMVYLDSWNPLVLPRADHDALFQRLVRVSIRHTRAIGRSRLEVFLMNLTDDIRSTYERYRPLYRAAAITERNKDSWTACGFTSYDLRERSLPERLSLRLVGETRNEAIQTCIVAINECQLKIALVIYFCRGKSLTKPIKSSRRKTLLGRLSSKNLFPSHVISSTRFTRVRPTIRPVLR